MKSKFSVIVFLILSFPLFAGTDVKILSSNSSSITIQYNAIFTDSSIVNINGNEYFDFAVLNGNTDFENNIGKPKIPYRLINISVPSEFGNTIEVLSANSTEIDGKILPVYEYRSGKKVYEEAQNYNEIINEGPITFDEYGISRNLRIQTIKISPVFFNPSAKSIRIYSQITFRVKFGSGRTDNVPIVDANLLSTVVNSNEAMAWGIDQKKLRKVNATSVLSEGTWYKFQAKDEGIYRISRSELSSLGINASSVDPRTIKIYNNGGKNLPENAETEVPTDLQEIPILVTGEADGVFNDNDEILFYGRGTDFWEYNNAYKNYVRYHHSFSKENYFWITSGGATGKRIQTENSDGPEGAVQQTSTIAFASLEEDKFNIGKSGREYWGDELNSSTKTLTYINPLTGRIAGEPINYNIRLANASSGNFNISIYESDNLISSRLMTGYATTDYYWGKAAQISATYNGVIPDNRSVLKLSFNASSSETRGYIDYIEIRYQRDLKSLDDQLLFFKDPAVQNTEFRLFNFSNSSIKTFDITDYTNVKRIEPVSINLGETIIRVVQQDEVVRKFLTVTDQAYKKISGIVKMENSNIHGISDGAEYVIITNKKFAEQAQRLKNYRESDAPEKMKSVVVYIDEILNEFSCGMMDPTAIRNFLRYAYLNWQTKPYYVFLFGDGIYDYYDIEKTGANYVPVYETLESLYEISSYPFDDYYSRIIGSDEKADLAVGRVNITSVNEAQTYIDKLIKYETKSEKGIWRNTITLIADDGITSKGDVDGRLHTQQSEILSQQFIPSYFNMSKIFLSKYPTVITGFGRRKPAVNTAIVDAVNNGSLLLNYTGHGNPDVWAHEVVFDRTTTLPLFVNDKYFFLTAATCDFGKYDNPDIVSGTEEMILLKDRGALGVFSASRAVYSDSNARINEEFYSNLFNGQSDPTLGTVFFKVKQKRTDVNDEKYHLFADPAVRLTRPTIPATIDEINGSVSTQVTQVKALSEVNISGSVRTSEGEINSSFNGEGIITVFDSEKKRYLEDINYTIQEQGGIIFRGRVAVTNGLFETSFRVPKDISYENKNGKIVAYIYDDENDGVGYTRNIVVGGTDTSVVDDGVGPDIEFLFDDAANTAGYLVNPDFTLLVKLKDETGLNTTGTGVGHKLEGIIDDDEANPVDFSNYFIGDLNAGGKSGVVDYKFTEFKPGEHKIQIKAWDVFNNPSSAETYFTVVSGDDISLMDVVNYPNPFNDNTTFTFQHNLEKALDVKIKIYTVAGRMIQELESKNILERFVKIPWNGRDNDGSQVASGTYLYKLIVKSIDGDYQKSILGKLAVFH